MRRSAFVNFGWIVSAYALAVTFGCGSDRHGSPGPGGSTFTGSVTNASTTAVARERSTWLAWLGENLLLMARSAYAQTTNTTLGGITVIARGDGREISALTDTNGGFQIANAPTGTVTVVFRRGSCEGSVDMGGVISNSTLNLVGVTFTCAPGSSAGAVTIADVGERFEGVTRDDPTDQSSSAVRLCTRVGNDDVLRTTSFVGASFFDTGGSPSTFGNLDQHDLLQIDGFRSGPGTNFTFSTQRVETLQHDVTDECAGV